MQHPTESQNYISILALCLSAITLGVVIGWYVFATLTAVLHLSLP